MFTDTKMSQAENCLLVRETRERGRENSFTSAKKQKKLRLKTSAMLHNGVLRN